VSGSTVRGLDADFAVTRGGFHLNIRLRVAPGETVALLGPNGAGKSTAIASIAGTIPIDSGFVHLGDRDLSALPPERRRVGVVFQDYLLFPHLSVLANVAFAPRALGVSRLDSEVRAMGWLDRLGIAALASRRPAGISGGEAQRVALARALAIEPELLLLDEPLAALDAEVRVDVRHELAGHLADFAGATVVVTHSLADVTALASAVVVLESGAVTQRATVAELMASPATTYVRRLVAARDGD
jgi:molybdate transport system ATP-binding protein